MAEGAVAGGDALAERVAALVRDVPDEVLDLDEVALAEGLVDSEREGPEEVLHGLLRRERETRPRAGASAGLGDGVAR